MLGLGALAVDVDQGTFCRRAIGILGNGYLYCVSGEAMNSDEHSESKPFWRSAVGVVLIGFLAVAAFLIIVEHRAHIFTGYWFIWLLPLVCLGMHFLHGGHGGDGDHDGRSSKGH